MRQELLSSIAETIKDYREGEIPRPTPDHVERWICQFDADVQLPMLQELDHVLAQTYLNRKFVMDFLESLLWEKQLVGTLPKTSGKRSTSTSTNWPGTARRKCFDCLTAFCEPNSGSA